MRVIPLLMVTLASTGCSGFVAASGTDLSKLTSKSEVRAKLGKPVCSGSYNDEPFEVYRTHRKLRDTSKGIGIVMLDTMTLGLGELYLLPRESFVAARQMIVGRELLVHYDKQGRVVAIEGDPDPFGYFRRTSLVPTEEPGPAQ